MKDEILISQLNDFIFCPASIYFHNLYGNMEKTLFQSTAQLNGTKAHETVDGDAYINNKKMICGLDVYSEKYRLLGKIDQYDIEKKILIERKKTVHALYDGFIFQIYAQYFAMREMDYEIEKLCIYSMSDNKRYSIKLPEQDIQMFNKFESLVEEIRKFSLQSYFQDNIEKCKKCIYEPACSKSLL